jgi:hypothetical protein
MKQLDFKRIGAMSVRVQTSDAVTNDLSLRVDEVRLYDPQGTGSGIAQGIAPGPFKEGARCYVEASKNSGATYQLSGWDAAIRFDDSAISKGGGFNTVATVGSHGYYAMGDFVIPSVIVCEADGLKPGVAARLAFVFESGSVEVDAWIPDSKTETRRWMHDRQDRVEKVWLLDEQDSLPTR